MSSPRYKKTPQTKLPKLIVQGTAEKLYSPRSPKKDITPGSPKKPIFPVIPKLALNTDQPITVLKESVHTEKKPIPPKTKLDKQAMSARKIRAMLGDNKEPNKTSIRKNFQRPEVFYYPKFPGHLAIQLTYEIDNKIVKKYLSYGQGKAESSNETSIANDEFKHGPGFSVALEMPESVNDMLINKAFSNFEKAARDKYELISKNCMHAVLTFLQESGYPISISNINSFSLPSTAAEYLVVMNIGMLKNNREILLKQHTPDEKSSINMIKKLIQNDIDRLYSQIMFSKTKIISFYSVENVNFQIRILKNIIERFNDAAIDVENTFDFICEKTKMTDDETTKHLKQCINLFPMKVLNYKTPRIDFMNHFLIKFSNKKDIPSTIANYFKSITSKDLEKESAFNISKLTTELKNILIKHEKKNDKWSSLAAECLKALKPQIGSPSIVVAKTPHHK
jgi:hypothetical protein